VAGALIVRSAAPGDGHAIADIYAPYVRDTAITFEVDPPDAAEMRSRIAETTARFPWLVAEEDRHILGYAYATAFRARAAYRWIVETTVYVAQGQSGRGIGRALYAPLLNRLKQQGFCAAIGAIALPNNASVAIHEAMGFTHRGTYEQVGYKLDRWHDVGLWQYDFGARPDRPSEPLPPNFKT
jgi:phosphinothricin acetyltransferase